MFKMFFLTTLTACVDLSDTGSDLSDIKVQGPSDPSAEPAGEPSGEPGSEPSNQPDSEPDVNQPASEPDDTSPPVVGEDTGPFTTIYRNIASDAQGYIEVPVTFSQQASSVLITLQSSKRMALLWMEDPAGNQVLNATQWTGSNERLTDAVYTSNAHDVYFNWPVRSTDTPLYEGDWNFVFFAWDDNGNASPNTPVDAAIQIKRDSNLSSATVSVKLAYAQGIQQNAQVVMALNQAISQWEALWAQWGFNLDLSVITSTIPATIPSPYEGDPAYAALSAQGNDADIFVVIGESITGFGSQLGVAGGVPGTLVSANRAVVTLSWLNAAGVDGQFDSIDIRLLAETLAHETGHYLGLFHPVEPSWALYDALQDTPTCNSESACESLFKNNLMYVWPVCSATDCEPQDTLSVGQQEIMHRYTGSL